MMKGEKIVRSYKFSVKQFIEKLGMKGKRVSKIWDFSDEKIIETEETIK